MHNTRATDMSNGLTRGLVAEPAVIDDGIQTTQTTWSSTKIAAEIAGGGGGGGGDVVGPASSTSAAIARYADSTGKLLANSGLLASSSSGSAAAPSLTWAASTTTGVYLASVGLGPSPAVGLAASGQAIVQAAPDRVIVSRDIHGASGLETAPGYTFSADTQAGVYYEPTSQGVGISAAGSLALLAAPTGGGTVLTAPMKSLTGGAVSLPEGATSATAALSARRIELDAMNTGPEYTIDFEARQGTPLQYGINYERYGSLPTGEIKTQVLGTTAISARAERVAIGPKLELPEATSGADQAILDLGGGVTQCSFGDAWHVAVTNTDTSTQQVGLSTQYLPIRQQVGTSSSGYISAEQMLANQDLDDTLASDTLVWNVGPYDAANGLSAPTTELLSVNRTISMIIDSSRIWRTRKAGFEIQAGKTISLDGGANTMVGTMKGRTTWVPVWSDGVTNATIGSNLSYYQVIGNCVMFSGKCTVTSKAGLVAGNAIRISLPWSVNVGADIPFEFSTGVNGFTGGSANSMEIAGRAIANTSYSNIMITTNVAGVITDSAMTWANLTAGNGAVYTWAGIYFT